MARASFSRWRTRLATAGAALLMVACCLGAPLIVGVAGTLTVGSAIGGAAIFAALLASCLVIARRLSASRR